MHLQVQAQQTGLQTTQGTASNIIKNAHKLLDICVRLQYSITVAKKGVICNKQILKQ